MRFLTPIEYLGYYKVWTDQTLSSNAIEGTSSINLTQPIVDEIQYGEIAKLRFGSTVIKVQRVDDNNIESTEPLPRTILSSEQPYIYITARATESEHLTQKKDLDIAIEGIRRSLSGNYGQKTKLIFFTNTSGAILTLATAIEYNPLTEYIVCTFYERNADNSYSEARVKYSISGTELKWSSVVAFNGLLRLTAIKITH